jgi:predicted DNA-binding transcriptional regulator AlpA
MSAPTQLMTEADTANLLNLTKAALRKWRRLGMGPRYHRIGSTVRYSREEVASWIDRNTFVSHAEELRSQTTGGSFSGRCA